MSKQLDKQFYFLWAGQFVSQLGSLASGFAVGVWIYQQTGSAMAFALSLLVTALPVVIISPLAGVLIDRFNRRQLMLVCDLGSVAGAAILLTLWWSDQLALWQLYVIICLFNIFSATQELTYRAAVPLIVADSKLTAANAWIENAQAIARISAPALGGLLIGAVGLGGVIFIDLLTFLFAALTILVVRVPSMQNVEQTATGDWRADLTFGWRYIIERPGLRNVLLTMTTSNIFFAAYVASLSPLVLSVADAGGLGLVVAAEGIGSSVAASVMTFSRSEYRKIYGFIGGGFATGVAVFLAGFSTWIVLLVMANFLFGAAFAVLQVHSHTIWQSKVPRPLHGRVFSVRKAFAFSVDPVFYALSGLLLDRVLIPALGAQGGLRLLLAVCGLGLLVLWFASLFNPRLQNLDNELPDAVTESPKALAA